MENPAYWTKATNIIQKALTERAEEMAAAERAGGVIFGYSTAMHIERRLREAGMLRVDSAEITGYIQE
jgi:hypothetical protein